MTMQNLAIWHKRFGANFEVFDVRYDTNNRPLFLIYHDYEWILADGAECIPALSDQF